MEEDLSAVASGAAKVEAAVTQLRHRRRLVRSGKTLRRSQWNLGRIVRIFPGYDGLVRAVDVCFDLEVFRRRINMLALLKSASVESVPETTHTVENEAVPA